MLELLCMSILGASYVYACIDERAKEKKLKEEERIFELKLKVFWYAVSNNTQCWLANFVGANERSVK